MWVNNITFESIGEDRVSWIDYKELTLPTVYDRTF